MSGKAGGTLWSLTQGDVVPSLADLVLYAVVQRQFQRLHSPCSLKMSLLIDAPHSASVNRIAALCSG